MVVWRRVAEDGLAEGPTDFRFPEAAFPPRASSPVSVIIHTRNEELHLPFALASVGWAEQVFVVDSESSDATRGVAQEWGVTVVSRACERAGLVAQRNWALATLPFRHPWALVVDADEVVSPQLAHEVTEFVSGKTSGKDGFWAPSKLIFMGRWLRFGSGYPNWTVRLLRHACVRYEPRAVNSHPVLRAGREGYLRGHLLHVERRGFEAYLRRTMEIGRLEAREVVALRNGAGPRPGLRNGSLFGGPAERRRWLKHLYMRLPARPVAAFWYVYLLRGGFLEGYPGLVFASWRAFSELYTDVCGREAALLTQSSRHGGVSESPHGWPDRQEPTRAAGRGGVGVVQS